MLHCVLLLLLFGFLQFHLFVVCCPWLTPQSVGVVAVVVLCVSSWQWCVGDLIQVSLRRFVRVFIARAKICHGSLGICDVWRVILTSVCMLEFVLQMFVYVGMIWYGDVQHRKTTSSVLWTTNCDRDVLDVSCSSFSNIIWYSAFFVGTPLPHRTSTSCIVLRVYYSAVFSQTFTEFFVYK